MRTVFNTQLAGDMYGVIAHKYFVNYLLLIGWIKGGTLLAFTVGGSKPDEGAIFPHRPRTREAVIGRHIQFV